MTDLKPCVRCERPIDAYARTCVYCSWDQATPRPAETAPPMMERPYVPPADNRARNKLFGAAAFVVLVIVAFAVGAYLNREHGDETSSNPAHTTSSAPGSTPRSTVTLVPVEGGVSSVQPEAPVTTAPAQTPSAGNVDINGERADATALPSEAYTAAAQRAKAERAVRTNSGTIDPRTIVGAVEQRPRRVAPSEQPQPAGAAPAPSTQPIPLYQPVPSMNVDRPTSARLFLTVGTDGRVHDINVAQSIPGEMPRLIASVQNWRFKPATQNGEPVTSTFSVDINVHPR
ncbi:MAG TPA: energy transducer TonB [Thermoanaerobaculia bacterium]